jgi:transcriptional regulator with XRE-family HTH domain
LYQKIGQLIRTQRKQRGMTQADLASAVEISRPSLVNIELGRQRVLVHMLYDLAEVLGCLPGDLAPKLRLAQRDVIYLTSRTRRVQARRANLLTSPQLSP